MNDDEIDSIFANFMHDIEVFGSEVVGTPTDADMKRLDGIYKEYRHEIKSRDQQITLEAQIKLVETAETLVPTGEPASDEIWFTVEINGDMLPMRQDALLSYLKQSQKEGQS